MRPIDRSGTGRNRPLADLKPAAGPNGSLAILERATWSQTDREPRAPSKILRALSVVTLVASFLRGFSSRERPATQAIPKWPHAGFYLCRMVFSSQLIVGFLKQTFYCLILAGQREPRDGHREMKFAGLEIGMLLEPPIDNLPRYRGSVPNRAWHPPSRPR
jgi:hypothetical protein